MTNYNEQLIEEVKESDAPKQTDIKPSKEVSTLPLLNPYLYSDELISAIDELEPPQ